MSTSEQIDITQLIKENTILKTLNEKLYKRTLNQNRKLLRLKRQMREGHEDKPVEAEPEAEAKAEPRNIGENIWEDIKDVIASYNL
jgi:hypothetical protein